MAWKPTGFPMVRKQRDKWVVRVDGVDTFTGKHKPKQLGTYKSQRSALNTSALTNKTVAIVPLLCHPVTGSVRLY